MSPLANDWRKRPRRRGPTREAGAGPRRRGGARLPIGCIRTGERRAGRGRGCGRVGVTRGQEARGANVRWSGTGQGRAVTGCGAPPPRRLGTKRLAQPSRWLPEGSSAAVPLRGSLPPQSAVARSVPAAPRSLRSLGGSAAQFLVDSCYGSPVGTPRVLLLAAGLRCSGTDPLTRVPVFMCHSSPAQSELAAQAQSRTVRGLSRSVAWQFLSVSAPLRAPVTALSHSWGRCSFFLIIFRIASVALLCPLLLITGRAWLQLHPHDSQPSGSSCCGQCAHVGLIGSESQAKSLTPLPSSWLKNAGSSVLVIHWTLVSLLPSLFCWRTHSGQIQLYQCHMEGNNHLSSPVSPQFHSK